MISLRKLLHLKQKNPRTLQILDLDKMSTPFLAFLQATGVVIYISLVISFISYIANTFKDYEMIFVGPMIMLLLFILSAVICATLFLGRAGILFWKKKYKASFTLIAWTVGWGLFYFAMLVSILF